MSQSSYKFRGHRRRNHLSPERLSVKKTLVYMGIIVLLFFVYIIIQEHRQPAGPESTVPPGTISLADYQPGADNPGLLRNSAGNVPLLITAAEPSQTRGSLFVSIADTQELRSAGLSNIESFTPEMEGMLFVFISDTEAAFWMKEMLFPLSIAFISADGQIIEIMDMPLCEQEDQQYCPLFRPQVMYRYALEVKAGWFAERGIQPGDRLFLQTE